MKIARNGRGPGRGAWGASRPGDLLRRPWDKRQGEPLSPALSPSDGAREGWAKRSRVVYPTDLATRRRGFVLVMVLVVIMLASMVAASLLFVMGAEHTAAAASEGGDQAWAAAMSGVYQAIRMAADPTTEQADWQDNAAVFRDQLVQDDGVQKWYFSVYSLPDAGEGTVRFGLTDEASRVNVYQATEAMLEALPNLTPPLAQALLSTPAGAGPSTLAVTNDDSASALPASTSLANPRWTCLDELLDVSGFSVALLYGSYSNLTSRGLTQTNAFDGSTPADAGAGAADLGLSHFLTVCSYDLNQDNSGLPRVNLNAADADLNSAGLPAATADYLKALLASGQSLTNVADLLGATNTFKNDQGKDVAMSSGITPAELPALLDHCTVTNQTNLVGRINLNTASAKVLAALPGMNDALAASIIAARSGLDADAQKTIAWLVHDSIVPSDVFKQIAPYLTTRSYQFHFFAAAYSVPPANYRVLEAVVDVACQPPAILLLREASRLGVPFDTSNPGDPTAGAIPGGAVSYRNQLHPRLAQAPRGVLRGAQARHHADAETALAPGAGRAAREATKTSFVL